MRRLIFRSSAQDDLRAILDHLADASGDIDEALRFVEGIVGRCQRLAELPGAMGTDRSELLAGMRSTPHRGYVIFFRYAPGQIEIIDVLHGARDVLRAITGEH